MHSLKELNDLLVSKEIEIKEGDIVLVDPAALNKATLVPINDKDERAILVSPFDIIQVW